MEIDEPVQNHIMEYNYFERFQMNDLKEMIQFLNSEQLQHGRIIEMEAEETREQYRIFIIWRIKFDKSKKMYSVLNLCSNKVPHHLKINGCDFALLFDLPKKK